MSTPDDFPVSVAQQKAYLSAELNSTLMLNFLFGIYAGLFSATIYIYIHKENRTRARDMIIIGSTATLYIATVLNVLCYWISANMIYCKSGATTFEMFIGSGTDQMPPGVQVISDVTAYIVFLLADGLLVWRCFHSCGGSFRKSFLPMALLIVETVLTIFALVYACLIDVKPNFGTNQTARIYNYLSAAAYVSVAATSLVSTGIICLQIRRHTALSSRSRKHYQAIINALIESSAAYTFSILFPAVLDFVMTGNPSFELLDISRFATSATQVLSGLAPTLMIARLLVSSGQEESEVISARLPSDLIGRASHATGTNVANIGADLDIEQRGSIGVEEEENEDILVVTRAEYELKHKDEGNPETAA
ncbi:hypothetical protein CPC08DRAFT_767717 [Agrocybe pediades]|nr:hypothetical protein CPC08DRAFT_767717 [Agrocybe pediades]